MSMAVFFKENEYRETAKAVGLTIKHRGTTRMVWFPLGSIDRNPENKNWRRTGVVNVPDWLYNKKFAEAFGGAVRG